MIDPTQILHINGCSMGDQVFSLDPRLSGEHVHWNVTRIKADAEAGLFGRPIKRTFASWPPMTDIERTNIDWNKVATIMGMPAVMLMPAIAVDVNAGTETHRHIVDGNHRVCARERCGCGDFELFIVPPDKETDYRVTFRDGNGKPVNFPF